MAPGEFHFSVTSFKKSSQLINTHQFFILSLTLEYFKTSTRKWNLKRSYLGAQNFENMRILQKFPGKCTWWKKHADFRFLGTKINLRANVTLHWNFSSSLIWCLMVSLRGNIAVFFAETKGSMSRWLQSKFSTCLQPVLVRRASKPLKEKYHSHVVLGIRVFIEVIFGEHSVQCLVSRVCMTVPNIFCSLSFYGHHLQYNCICKFDHIAYFKVLCFLKHFILFKTPISCFQTQCCQF